MGMFDIEHRGSMADRARARRERDEESGRHERLKRQLQAALEGRGVEPARELSLRWKEGWGAGGDVATHSVTGAWLPRSPRPHTTRASVSGSVGNSSCVDRENGVPRLPRTPRAARSGNAFRTTRTIADLCDPQRHAWLPSGHGTRNTDVTNYSRACEFGAARSPRLPSMADNMATESRSSLVEPTLEFRARNFWPTATGNFSPGDCRR